MIRTFVVAAILFSFNVFAQSADLTMFRTSSPTRQHLDLRIHNFGNLAAQNVRVTLDFPAALTIRRVDLGECATTEVPVRCTFPGALAPNSDPFRLIVDFTAPPADATYTVTARVSSDTPDSNPNNDVVTYTFETRIVDNLNIGVSPDAVRVDPGATQVFTFDVSNYEPTLPPGDLLVKLNATAGMTIEKIDAPLWTCTIDGGTAECRAPALDPNCRCGREFLVTVRANTDLAGGVGALEALVSGNLPDTYDGNNRATATVQTYRHLVVNTNADAGAGSLRAAMEEANAIRTGAPAKIVFAMPSADLHAITPATALPAITADRLFIDGGAKITIDGSAAHYGLDLRTRCEGVVQRLKLQNFGDQALAMSTGLCNDNLDQRRVSDNTIMNNFRGLRLDGATGVTVRDNVIANNLRSGIWSWNGDRLLIHRNRFENNGASGIFLGPDVNDVDVASNTIVGSGDMGIAAAYGAKLVRITHNAIRDNRGLGIDWGLDGVSPVDVDDSNIRSNAPVILSARYDAAVDLTKVTMTLPSKPIGFYPLWVIDVFANDAPDGDGEQLIGQHQLYANPDGSFEVVIGGNHTGKWLNATSTRVHSIYLELYIGPADTSELSNAVLTR